MRIQAQLVEAAQRRLPRLNRFPDRAELGEPGNFLAGKPRAGGIEIGAQLAQALVHHHADGLVGQFELIIQEGHHGGIVVKRHGRFAGAERRRTEGSVSQAGRIIDGMSAHIPAAGAANDVVVVGNAGLDTQAYLPPGEVDWSADSRFVRVRDGAGQAGAYASRGYARLGFKTAFVGHLGDDAAGHFVRQVLTRDHVDVQGVWLDPAGTARSVNLVLADGSRKAFYDGRDHMTLAPDLEACRHALRGARLAHVNLANWARQVIPLARSAGARVATDLQDVRALDDAYRTDFITGSDYLFLSGANLAQPADFVRALLARRPDRIVVAGLGADGCLVGTAQAIAHFPALDAFGPVVDTNGAGDALAVGFLSAHALLGLPIAEAARWGQRAARYTCALRAPKDGLIDRETISAAWV